MPFVSTFNNWGQLHVTHGSPVPRCAKHVRRMSNGIWTLLLWLLRLLLQPLLLLTAAYSGAHGAISHRRVCCN